MSVRFVRTGAEIPEFAMESRSRDRTGVWQDSHQKCDQRVGKHIDDQGGGRLWAVIGIRLLDTAIGTVSRKPPLQRTTACPFLIAMAASVAGEPCQDFVKSVGTQTKLVPEV